MLESIEECDKRCGSRQGKLEELKYEACVNEDKNNNEIYELFNEKLDAWEHNASEIISSMLAMVSLSVSLTVNC